MKTTNINIRITPELKAKLQEAADKDNRSLSNYIEVVLSNSVKTAKPTK